MRKARGPFMIATIAPRSRAIWLASRASHSAWGQSLKPTVFHTSARIPSSARNTGNTSQ